MRKTRYPGIWEMGQHSYRIRARATDPRTGKAKEVDRIRECTPQEALKLQLEWVEEIRKGPSRADRVRLRQYAESWMRIRVEKLKPSVACRYAGVLDDHILPSLGDFYLDALTPSDVSKWINEKAKIFSPGSLNCFLRVLRVMVRDAMADLDLPRDPCARVKAPKSRAYGDENPNLLAGGELGKLLDAAQKHEPKWFPVIATLALTGLRLGEATALRWEDIDWQRGEIKIKRSQWRGQVSSTKTGTIRTVPLTKELAEILEAHHRRLVAEQNSGLKKGLVFPSSVGGYFTPNVLRKPLNRALKAAGVPQITVHGLRRSFNNLARQVTSGEIVRSITGHVTEGMTWHYSHINAQEKLAAATSVLRLIRGGAGDRAGDQEGNASEQKQKAL